MKLLTKQQQESYENGKVCYISKKNFETTYAKDKKYCKFRDPCHYAGEQRSAILAYVISNIVHLKNPYNFFIMDLTMIIILS